MKSRILGVLLVFTSGSHAQTQAKIHDFAAAVARAEGFGIKGSVAQRFHNPGDICTTLKHGYPGQIGVTPHGYAVFASDADGWRALESNLTRIYTNHSRHYNRDMTIKQIAGIYARDPNWVRNVCGYLKIDPNMSFAEFVCCSPKGE